MVGNGVDEHGETGVNEWLGTGMAVAAEEAREEVTTLSFVRDRLRSFDDAGGEFWCIRHKLTVSDKIPVKRLQPHIRFRY